MWKSPECLRTVGVYLGKSVDEHNRERFHSYDIYRAILVDILSWLVSQEYAENPPVAVRETAICLQF